MAHQQEDYDDLYDGNVSPRGTSFALSSPGFSSILRSSPTRNVSTVGSSVMSGDIISRMKSREQRMLWGTKVHWFLPTLMFGLLLFGFLGAVSHHLFYDSLDGKEARNQLAMIRIGTALAFFTKATLVGSVVIAYRQRVWQTLREKPVSLKGIDGMFAVVEDPTHFVTKELYTKAKIGTAMAVATWIIPLASVLSPAALTTGLTEISRNRTCNVSLLNFASENTADWRKPRYRPGDSLSFYNITPPNDLPLGKAVDYFDQPSHNAVRLVTLTILGHQFIPMQSPCVGWNCTWDVEFDGPWYNCSELTPLQFMLEKPVSMNHTYEQLAPEGNKIYFGYDDYPEYSRPQPNYNETELTEQGIFLQEPRIWFGYTINTTRPAAPGSEAANKWGSELERRLVRCELQKAHYKTHFNYTNNRQNYSIEISGGVPINPQDDDDGIGPRSKGYHEYSAYHSLGMLARSQVAGWMTRKDKLSPVLTFSPITQTKLIDVMTAYPLPNLKLQFERLFEEIVITLFSEDYLEISTRELVACEVTRHQNNFRYQRMSLWIGYAFSIVFATASLIVGGFSIIANGITSDTTFSKIMVTTRNRTLDRVVATYEGVCLGGDPFPEELEDTQLMFGVIDGGTRKHAAFGTVGEVIPIKRGDSYVRLSEGGVHYRGRGSSGSRGSWAQGSGTNSPDMLNTRTGGG